MFDSAEASADGVDVSSSEVDTGPVGDSGARRDAWADGQVPMPRPGVIVCGGEECPDGFSCCYATGRCFSPTAPQTCEVPPRDVDPFACASNEQCEPSEV